MVNGRCSKHGGKSLVGPAAPGFRHGRYSKLLPAQLAARYTEAQVDPELLGLRDEIALIDARINDVLQRMDRGESSATWETLQKLARGLRRAVAADDRAETVVHTALLQTVVERAGADAAGWREVFALVNQRRVLVESERRRLVQMRQMVSAEQAMTLAAALVAAVKRHVPDRQTQGAISDDIRALLEHLPGAERSLG
jgi:hypothetical protein